MKILILSDTHGQTEAACDLIRSQKPNRVFHLGDCLRDARDLSDLFPYLPICCVPGNNDFFGEETKEKTVLLEGTKIFYCHGHTTGVKRDLSLQKMKTLQNGCTVSLFGHTHRPLLEQDGPLLLLNPGSLTYSGTYGILTLSRGESPRGDILSYE